MLEIAGGIVLVLLIVALAVSQAIRIWERAYHLGRVASYENKHDIEPTIPVEPEKPVIDDKLGMFGKPHVVGPIVEVPGAETTPEFEIQQ